MSLITKFDAVHALVGGGIIKDGENWALCDGQEMPSEEAIQAKLKELQDDFDSKQYQRDRSDASPSWQDQMDMLYHKGVAGWKAEIKKVKDKYPKP